MNEKKKVPKPVFRWITFLGVLAGLTIAGTTFILLPHVYAMPVWIGFLVIFLGAIYLTDFRNRDLMDEWGITERKGKKEQ